MSALLYETHPPSPALAPHVECCWTMRGTAVALGDDEERVLPDGRIEIVLNCGDPVWQRDGDSASRQPLELLVGPGTRPVRIRPSGTIDIVGIRFRHGGAHALLRTPAAELADRIVALDDVRRIFPASVRDELCAAPSSGEKIAIVERHLLRHLGRRRARASGTDAAARAAEMLVSSGGALRVDDAATAVGLGGRQLARRFAVEVGVGPKLLARLGRFHRLLRLVAADRPPTLAAAAACAGYADQSHLARDFREFAEEPASSFFRARHQLSAFFLSLEGPPA